MKFNYILIFLFLLCGINLKAQKKAKSSKDAAENYVGKIVFSSDFIYYKKPNKSSIKSEFHITDKINLHAYLENSVSKLVGGKVGELKWSVSINGVEAIQFRNINIESHWKFKNLYVEMFEPYYPEGYSVGPKDAYQNAILNCGYLDKDIKVKITVYASKKDKEPINVFLAEGTFTIKAFTKNEFEKFKEMSFARKDFAIQDRFEITDEDEKKLLDEYRNYIKYGKKRYQNRLGIHAFWAQNDWEIAKNTFTSIPLYRYKEFRVIFSIGNDTNHCFVEQYYMVSQYSGGGNYSKPTIMGDVDDPAAKSTWRKPFPCIAPE
jgi:hypothetical protein